MIGTFRMPIAVCNECWTKEFNCYRKLAFSSTSELLKKADIHVSHYYVCNERIRYRKTTNWRCIGRANKRKTTTAWSTATCRHTCMSRCSKKPKKRSIGYARQYTATYKNHKNMNLIMVMQTWKQWNEPAMNMHNNSKNNINAKSVKMIEPELPNNCA